MTDEDREPAGPGRVDAITSVPLPDDLVPDEFDRAPTRAERAAETIREHARDGSLAAIGAAGSLAGAVLARGRSRAVSTVLGVAGTALAALAVRQRRSEVVPLLERDDVAREGTGSAETAERGIEFASDADEPRPKPGVDADVDDPRRDVDGEDVEIDLSEAATAAEASEAVGPDPEQAQPASTQGTEPEPTPATDVQSPPADAIGEAAESEDASTTEAGDSEDPSTTEAGDSEDPSTTEAGDSEDPPATEREERDADGTEGDGDRDAPDSPHE